MLQEEVTKGWQLPLPTIAADVLPNTAIAPLGLVLQASIDDKGNIVDKYRLTHDMTFEMSEKGQNSVNNRVIPTNLTPCRYGQALLRVCHKIVFLRHNHPNEKILLTKVDWKSAYRRLHLHVDTAAQSMVSIDGMLLMALRMTFGGAPNPSQWSDITEPACDLANDLCRRPDWSPAEFQSPHHKLLQKAVDNDRALDQSTPFQPAKNVIHPHLFDIFPSFDNYIDDQFGAFLARHAKKGTAVLPFVIYLLGRPPDTRNFLPRDDLLSLSKFFAEASPSELKIILGWLLNTRELLLSLPRAKYKAWIANINQLLSQQRITLTNLDQLIGRLQHATYVIPFAKHFLGQLRAAQQAATRKPVTLSAEQRHDLHMWKELLLQARNGISLNLLIYREPDYILRVDACPQGLGGYSLTTGVAWRYKLPNDLIGRASLNTLEFLAAHITNAMQIEHGNIPKYSTLLTQGDSTTAAGWLGNSNFNDGQPTCLHIARSFSRLYHRHQLINFSQWFPGDENGVADSLSRDFHITNTQLSQYFITHLPTQVPPNFTIYQLPRRLVSFIGTALRRQPKTEQLQKQPKPSTQATGIVTWLSSNASTSKTIHSSDTSHPHYESASCAASQQASEKTKHSDRRAHNIAIFYSTDNSKVTETPTQPQTNKKH